MDADTPPRSDLPAPRKGKTAPPAARDPEPAATFIKRGDPTKDPEAARFIHLNAVGSAAYMNCVNQRLAGMVGSSDVLGGVVLYMNDVLARMQPKDPLEEMLIVQAVVAHARALHLSELACRQTDIETVRIVNEYADRASNGFRRLMLGLAEYRRPPAASAFMAIKQANLANQQVIQNHENAAERNATNEQGCRPAQAPAALPADPRGAGIAPGIGTAGEAVDAVHRSKDPGRQGPIQPKRPQARRKVG